MPAHKDDAVVTGKQEKVRDLFAAASAYAKSAVADPELKREYREKATPGTNSYNIAFRDYLKAPVVQEINTENYNGMSGSTIDITAIDDFRVIEVAISIHTAAGALIEEGNAVLNPINRYKWKYTARQSNISPPGTVIKATARDLPGNEGALDATI